MERNELIQTITAIKVALQSGIEFNTGAVGGRPFLSPAKL